MADENSTEAPKKKHKHLFLKIFIPILVVLVVVPVVFLYAFIYDTSGEAVEVDENYSIKDTITRLLNKSLDETKETGTLVASVEEADLNQVIMGPLNKANKNMNGYYGGYVEITDENYVFHLKIKPSPIFETHIALYTTIGETEDATAYRFAISGAKIGRLSVSANYAVNYLKGRIPEDKVNEVFASAGTHVTVDYDNKQFIYKKSDIRDDLLAYLGPGEEDFFYAALSALFDMDVVDIDFNDDKKCTVSVDLSSLSTNGASYVPDSTRVSPTDFSKYITKTESLLDEGTISEDDAQYVYDYFMFGYDGINSDKKAVVDASLASVDLSDIGISSYKDYTGLGLGEDLDTDAMVADLETNLAALIVAGATSGSAGSISEGELTDYMKTSDLIGNSYLFISEDDDGAHNVNYIGIDDVYIDLANDKMTLNIGFSFNGYETWLVGGFSFLEDEDNEYGFSLSFDTLSFGEHDLSDAGAANFRSSLFNIMASSVNGYLEYFTVDDTTSTIDVDLSNAIVGSNFDNARKEAGYALDITLKGEGASSDGYVDFYVSK